MARGWRHDACIIIAMSNLGYGYPERRVRGGRDVAWFPAPDYPSLLRFDVMMGRPDAEQLTVGNVIDDVGRMTMRSRVCVWIVATEHPTTPEYEADMAGLRSELLADAPEGTAAVRGWAWGEIDNGVPQLLDLSGGEGRQ